MAHRNLGSKYFEKRDAADVLHQIEVNNQELCPVCGMKFGTKRTVMKKGLEDNHKWVRVHARPRCKDKFNPNEHINMEAENEFNVR